MGETCDANTIYTDRLEQLTLGQRDCLRLVGQYMSSKEIARRLKISHHTVDQRLKRATFLLGVHSRSDAARILMREERHKTDDFLPSSIYDDLVYQATPLSEKSVSDMIGASLDTLNRSSDGAQYELHEQQAPYFGASPRRPERTSFWSVLVEIDRENKLSAQSRVLVMVGIAVTAIIGFGALINIAEGLSRLQ
jgi:DNA-binding CsgD family transcriptional regulator